MDTSTKGEAKAVVAMSCGEHDVTITPSGEPSGTSEATCSCGWSYRTLPVFIEIRVRDHVGGW